MIYNTKVKAIALKNKSDDVEVINMKQEDIRDLYQYLTKQIELDYIRLDTINYPQDIKQFLTKIFNFYKIIYHYTISYYLDEFYYYNTYLCWYSPLYLTKTTK